jgi:hypothetical protein
MILMTWVYIYHWPLPLLKYRKKRPCLQCCANSFNPCIGRSLVVSFIKIKKNG